MTETEAVENLQDAICEWNNAIYDGDSVPDARQIVMQACVRFLAVTLGMNP